VPSTKGLAEKGLAELEEAGIVIWPLRSHPLVIHAQDVGRWYRGFEESEQVKERSGRKRRDKRTEAHLDTTLTRRTIRRKLIIEPDETSPVSIRIGFHNAFFSEVCENDTPKAPSDVFQHGTL